MPKGRTLDTVTFSDVFHSPPIVAVHGLQECVSITLLEPMPQDAKPLEYENKVGPFGPYRIVSPRWNP